MYSTLTHRIYKSMSERLLHAQSQNTSGKKMKFRVEEWWLAKRLVIVHNHQPPTCVLLYAEFSMLVKCVLRWGGQRCLTASKICLQLDSQGVGWLWLRDRCEHSDVEERLCHNHGHVLSKTNWSQTRIASNHTHAIMSSTSIRVNWVLGKYMAFMAVITNYSVQLFTLNGHTEFQWKDLLQTVTVIFPFIILVTT